MGGVLEMAWFADDDVDTMSTFGASPVLLRRFCLPAELAFTVVCTARMLRRFTLK